MLDERLADDIDQFLGHLFERGAPESGSMREPAVIASMLVARARTNFSAMRILIAAGHDQEAQALFRCLIEAAICLCAMRSDRDAFVADFISHSARGAEATLPLFPRESRLELEERTKRIFGERGPDGAKHRLLNWHGLARDAEAEPLYNKYRFYSNAAVHVSGMSLSVHPAIKATRPVARATAAGLSNAAMGEAQAVLLIAAEAFCDVMNIPEPEGASSIVGRVHADLSSRGFIRSGVDKPAGQA